MVWPYKDFIYDYNTSVIACWIVDPSYILKRFYILKCMLITGHTMYLPLYGVKYGMILLCSSVSNPDYTADQVIITHVHLHTSKTKGELILSHARLHLHASKRWRTWAGHRPRPYNAAIILLCRYMYDIKEGVLRYVSSCMYGNNWMFVDLYV